MTLTRTDWAKNNTVPPKSNEAVSRIMAERGVNRRRAYELLRAQKMAEVDTSNVGQGQRLAVMRCLIKAPSSGRDATVLLDALHRAGVKIDMHDTVKTLWALQKARHVQFRERGSRSLYAIKLTGEGLAAYEEMTTPPAHRDPLVLEIPEEPTIFQSAPPPLVTVIEMPSPEMQTAENALDLAAEVLADSFKRPWLDDMEDWPAFRAVRDRARKAGKINQAAKLLEEAGEEDIALTLMGRTDFTELEQEVINLLRTMGEITE